MPGHEHLGRGTFLERVGLDGEVPEGRYPFDIPAVRDLGSLPFGQVTVLVGDNGSGKSTIVEALAVAAGFNAEGGSRNLRFETLSTHSELSRHIELQWRRRARWGWFLRAETFYGMATYIASDDPRYGIRALFGDLHGESHGESFLDVASSKFRDEGLYILDEPEAALSLHGQLRLLRIMYDSCAIGSQFVVATHSPALMAYPGAVIAELTDSGITTPSYDDVETVQLWRQFLDAPERFFRHLFDD